MSRMLLRPFAVIFLAGCASSALAQEPPRGPQGGAGTVTMSRSEYDRLLDLSSRRPIVDTAPAAVLSRADIRVRVAGSSARATMRVDGEVFGPAWRRSR